jgi:hypothetical protein
LRLPRSTEFGKLFSTSQSGEAARDKQVKN